MTEFVNPVKKKLLDGETVVGTWIMTSSIDNAEILSAAGFDFIMIDSEHGCMNIETVGQMVSMIKGAGGGKTMPFLRVPWNNIYEIKRGLDAGPLGIMIPFINTKEEAEQAISYCKYPPAGGVRGMGAGRATLFAARDNYFQYADKEVMTILQIEHWQAVENIDEILSVPGIDVAFVGPGDMSTSMGYMGQMDHPEVVKNCEKVIAACKKHNVIPGMLSGPGSMQKHLDMGFKLLLGGMDSMYLYMGARGFVKEFRQVAGQA